MPLCPARLRPINGADLPRLHALNESHAVELSSLSAEAFEQHVGRATLAMCAADVDAFILAYCETSPISGPNFDWFKARHARFLYIDRIAVAPGARRQGLARALYEAVLERARLGGWAVVGCEVNEDPPNPGSDAFHAAMGFQPVGQAVLADRGKTVRYFARAPD